MHMKIFFCGSLLYFMTCGEMTLFIVFICRIESLRELEAGLILESYIRSWGSYLNAILTWTSSRNYLLELIISTRAAQQTEGSISINLCSAICGRLYNAVFLGIHIALESLFPFLLNEVKLVRLILSSDLSLVQVMLCSGQSNSQIF